MVGMGRSAGLLLLLVFLPAAARFADDVAREALKSVVDTNTVAQAEAVGLSEIFNVSGFEEGVKQALLRQLHPTPYAKRSRVLEL